MEQVMDITKEINNLSDEDKSKIIGKFDQVGFSNAPGISLTPSDIKAATPGTESLTTSIQSILSSYNERYGLKFEDKDYITSLVSAANISENEREIRRLIDSQIITNIADILTTKSILIISKVISDQLDKIATITNNTGLNGELVGMIGEMFGWVEKLEELKSKYRLFNVDEKIKSLIKGESSNNLVRTPEQQKTLDMLKSILIPS